MTRGSQHGSQQNRPRQDGQTNMNFGQIHNPQNCFNPHDFNKGNNNRSGFNAEARYYSGYRP